MLYRAPALKLLMVVFICCVGDGGTQAQDTGLTADLLVLHKVKTQGDQPGDIAYVNLASGQVVARVPVGREPHELAVSADGKYALATNTGANSNPGNTLSLIDIATRKELKRVDLGPLWSPHGVTYRDGRFYFTAEGSRVIGAYDPVSDHVVWVTGTGQGTTHNLVFTPDGKTIFTANRSSDTVNMFQLIGSPLAANGWKSTIIPVCKAPQGLDASPDGKVVWIGCRGSNEMAIINVADGKVIKTFPTQTGQLARVRFTLDGKRVLAADLGRGELSIWDAATQQRLKLLKLGSYAEGILMLPDGKRALIGVTNDNNIAEIDLQSMEVTRRIYTGASPDGMAWIGAK